MGILTVRHVTIYTYSAPVRFGEHRMMFQPRQSHDLRLLSTKLDILFESPFRLSEAAGRVEGRPLLLLLPNLPLRRLPRREKRQGGPPARRSEDAPDAVTDFALRCVRPA